MFKSKVELIFENATLLSNKTSYAIVDSKLYKQNKDHENLKEFIKKEVSNAQEIVFQGDAFEIVESEDEESGFSIDEESVFVVTKDLRLVQIDKDIFKF